MGLLKPKIKKLVTFLIHGGATIVEKIEKIIFFQSLSNNFAAFLQVVVVIKKATLCVLKSPVAITVLISIIVFMINLARGKISFVPNDNGVKVLNFF